MFIEFVNQNIWWFLALGVVFNGLLWTVMQGSVAGASTVSVLEMPQLQRDKKSVVLDVNTSTHFAAQHIPNALNFPLEELSDDNAALLKHKDKTVILVDQTGSRSTKAAKKLITLGFSNVNILRGGLVSWTKENLPVTSV